MSFLFAGTIGRSPKEIGNECALMLREISLPKPEGDKFNLRIQRAATACGLDYWRAYDIFYRKARRIDHHEAEQIKEALRIKREKALANEFHDLKTRIAKFEAALLVQGNPDVHRDNASPAGFGVRRSR